MLQSRTDAAPLPESPSRLVWTGQDDWAPYLGEAVKRLPFDHVEELSTADCDAWQAHAAMATQSNVRLVGTCELAILGPGESQAPVPQHVVSSDRWQHLGLKTKLALFLQSSGSEHLCPETFALRWPDDMTLELESRVTAATPWVLKSTAGSKGDAVHFVTTPHQAKQLMQDAEAARGMTREALLEFSQVGDLWSDDEGDGEDAGEHDATYTDWDAGHVLQRHIDRPMLLEGGRKFTLRTYLLLHAATHRVWAYEHDYEVRLADLPYEQGTDRCGDVNQLLTNGSASSRSWGMDGTAHGAGWRRMASEYSELTELRPLIQDFMADCGRCLLPAASVAAASAPTTTERVNKSGEKKKTETQVYDFVGLDLMIEDSGNDKLTGECGKRCWMLEVNCFPGAAPFKEAEGKSAAFHQGMIGFCASLMAMVSANGVHPHWRQVAPKLATEA